MRTLLRFVISTVLALTAAHGWTAENKKTGFGFRIGAEIITDIDSDARVDARNSTRGTEFSFEDTLGLDDSATVARLDGYWRFGGRHHIDLGYFNISRDATSTLSQELRFRDDVFAVNARLDSELDTRVIKAAYRFSFLTEEQFEFGVSAGIHDLDIEVNINDVNGTVRSEADTRTPLPVVGLHGRITPIPKLHFGGSVEFFDVDVGDFEGSIADIRLALEHDTFTNVGFGVGYNVFTLDAELDDDEFGGEVEFNYQGLLLYLKGYF